MSKKKYELKPCRRCGSPAEEKIVNKPFSHGWVGCRSCGRLINWSGKGHMSVVDQWNREQREME